MSAFKLEGINAFIRIHKKIIIGALAISALIGNKYKFCNKETSSLMFDEIKIPIISIFVTKTGIKNLRFLVFKERLNIPCYPLNKQGTCVIFRVIWG
ncbi:hypothetical protein N750_00110 [Legionella pneumophila str. Leg01/53]|nr:hypothetical protein N750_00110 [Legionella pneumophila str. Leg01/53]